MASNQTDVDKRIRVADCILTDVDKIVSLLHHLVCKEALHRCHIPLVIIFRYFSSAWKQQNEGQKTEHHGIGDQQAKQPGMPTRGAVAEIDSDIWLVFAASSARCVHFTLEVYVSRPGKTFLFSFVGFYKYVFMDMSQPGVANSEPTMAYLDSRFDATFELLLPAESD